MEYPSRNDFFLRFKALYDENDKFIDYLLIDNSENFPCIINYKSNPFLGKRISEIVLEDEKDRLAHKEIYYHMIPKARRKFEIYIETLKCWYIINIFSDKRDFLLLIYTDITRYKNNVKEPLIEPFDGYEKIAK